MTECQAGTHRLLSSEVITEAQIQEWRKDAETWRRWKEAFPKESALSFALLREDAESWRKHLAREAAGSKEES